MNIKNFLIATILLVSFSACRETAEDDHGHEHADGVEHAHDEDGGHIHEENVEQEEFRVGEDSLVPVKESDHHTHDDGTVHDDH